MLEEDGIDELASSSSATALITCTQSHSNFEQGALADLNDCCATYSLCCDCTTAGVVLNFRRAIGARGAARDESVRIEESAAAW